MENIKIEIALVYKIEDEYKMEWVDAEKTGDNFRILSIPAFAGYVAYGDIVSAKYEDGILFFDDLIQSSGHSVIHIVVLNKDASPIIIDELIEMGLGVNPIADESYLVIDVPGHIDYRALLIYLLRQFEIDNLDFKESCLSDQHKKMSGHI
jgi:hypothetical protein